jgi:hypothetical protein
VLMVRLFSTSTALQRGDATTDGAQWVRTSESRTSHNSSSFGRGKKTKSRKCEGMGGRQEATKKESGDDKNLITAKAATYEQLARVSLKK